MAAAGKSLELAKTLVAVVLTFVAGYVDAVGWLTLDRIFTAQMSGNTVLLAVHLVQREWGHASLQAETIAAFFLGLVVTGSVIELGMRQHVRRIFVAAIAVEVLLLAAFAIAGDLLLEISRGETDRPEPSTYVLIAMVAFAMGTQNTSLRMAGILSVFTTHVTGAITGFSEEIIVSVFSILRSGTRRHSRGFASEALRNSHRTASRNMVRSMALLAGFFLGALAGAALLRSATLAIAMVVPLVLLAGVGAFDWVKPLTKFPSPPERE